MNTPKNKIKRALSVSDVLAYEPEIIPFDGEWARAVGRPELAGAWLVYGASGQGKTTFALQLGKYLCTLGLRVAYDSIEEGLSASVQEAFRRTGMADVSRSFVLLDREPALQLPARLRRRRSPDVVLVDSAQYSGLSTAQYKALVDDFPRKLFIFISHSDGGRPKGALAQAIYYDAFVCIRVKGFKALIEKSRYGGSGEITINERMAREYWSVAESGDNK